MEGALGRPKRKADVLAAEPPRGVMLPEVVHTRRGAIVRDYVASVLCDQVEGKVPPLADHFLGKTIAPGSQEVERRLRVVLRLLVGLAIPRGHVSPGSVLDLRGLGPNLRIDLLEVQVRVLVEEIERPPSDLEAELGDAALMTSIVLRRRAGGRAVEGQVGGAMRRIVPEPYDTPSVRLRLADERPRRSEHGERPLPLAHRDIGRHGSTIGVAEGPGGHADGQVELCAFVVVAVCVLNHLRSDGPLGGWHGRRIRVLRVWHVAPLDVELRTLLRAKQAEGAPHAAAAVEAQNVVQVRRDHILRRCVAVRVEEVEDAGRGGQLPVPPAHLLSQFRHTRTVHVVLGVAKVQLPDRERVGHHGDVIPWHSRRGPDGASIVLPCQDIEVPQLARRIGQGQALGATRISRVRRITAVRAEEA
mmetsp:Transcript_78577/g.228070  ORF Transcript_78577/g.228070 Transcript_78577/m.228070 type:complete len:417 (-) Transcript_78577:618-1868(-)